MVPAHGTRHPGAKSLFRRTVIRGGFSKLQNLSACSKDLPHARAYLGHNAAHSATSNCHISASSSVLQRWINLAMGIAMQRLSMPSLVFFRPRETSSAQRFARAPSYMAEYYDVRALVHQELRALTNDVLDAVSRIETSDEGEVIDTVANVRGLLLSCRTCLEYEDHVVRPVLEAHRHGTAALSEIDYLRDWVACDAVAADLAEIEYGAGEVRRAAARSLRRRLASFVDRIFTRAHVAQREMAALPEARRAGDQPAIGDGITSARPRALASLLRQLGRYVVVRSRMASNEEIGHGSAQRT
jgi:hypothetical protein